MRLKEQLMVASRLRTYFLRGHSNWFAYPMSMINFITISFYLLIENLTIVSDEFRFRHYLLLFVILYTPLAIVVGYFDMKKGTYRVEQQMAKELSPVWNELFSRIENIEMNQEKLLNLIKSNE